MSTNVLVLGAGKVGKSVAELLLAAGGGEYKVTIADRDQKNLDIVASNMDRLNEHVSHKVRCETARINVTQAKALREAMKKQDYVICMLPYDLVEGIATIANESGVHYFDVTEDVATTDKVRAIDAEGIAKVALVPQCGLAPGYIDILACDIASRFTKVHDLTLRVGALSQFPKNALKYNITWSVEGVINEYCEPCNVMLAGNSVKVPALDGLESLCLEGTDYEAFYTSGGVGTVIDTLIEQGKVVQGETNIAYKTIRYPGHRNLMKFLLDDLRFGVKESSSVVNVKQRGPGSLVSVKPKGKNKPAVNRFEPGAVEDNKVRIDRRLLMRIFDHAVPRTEQDVVVIHVTCIGDTASGARRQVNACKFIKAQHLWGRTWPAIELTTAAGVCGMLDLHRQGKLPRTEGFIRQEECPLAMFEHETVFGKGYDAAPGAIATG